MFPWYFFWAPQLHFPFSGSVAQNIKPDTRWFFDAITPNAGQSEIERRAFEVASYGRQLGLISEVLLDICQQTTPDSDAAKTAMARLAAIQAEIEKLKDEHKNQVIDDLLNQLISLQKESPQQYQVLLARLK